MTEDQFEQAVRQLINSADINQLSASIILEDLAKEQRDEFDEADIWETEGQNL